MLSDTVSENKQIYPLLSILLGFLLFVVGLVLAPEPWFYWFLSAVMLLLILFSYGKALLKVMCLAVPLCLVVYAIARLSATHTQAWQNSMRSLLFVLAACLSLTIEPIRLVRNLNQLKVPKILTLSLLVCLRFVGVIRVEMQRIAVAMQTRGAHRAWHKPQLMYRAFVLPLISRIFSISDTLSDSLEIRAYALDRESTSYKEVKLHVRDFLFAITLISLMMMGLVWKYGGFQNR